MREREKSHIEMCLLLLSGYFGSGLPEECVGLMGISLVTVDEPRTIRMRTYTIKTVDVWMQLWDQYTILAYLME